MRWYHHYARVALLSLCFMVGVSTFAFGDQNHYRNTLVGSRATGLAGAYTALSDDMAGCYYNPAGLAMVPTDSVSASMNAYYKSQKSYKNVLRDTGGEYHDWEQESSILLPNFFGVVKKWGIGRLGLSYAVPDSTLRRQQQNFTNIQSNIPGNNVDSFMINIDDTDQTYLFGPSYGLRLRDGLSIGATLYGYYRDKQIIRNQALFLEQGEHYWSNYYDTQTDWGLRPMLGIIWEPVEKIALGLTLAKTYLTSSSRRQQELLRNTTSSDFADTNSLQLNISSVSETANYPMTTALGVAYFVSPRLLFSFDCTYYSAVDDKQAVFNFAAGSEFYFMENMALRAGVYTDMANTQALTYGGVLQPEHVDIYNATLSLSIFNGPSSVTLGSTYGVGNGQAQVIEESTSIQDVEISAFSIFLAASYMF